jgi:hypothetical protein
MTSSITAEVEAEAEVEAGVEVGVEVGQQTHLTKLVPGYYGVPITFEVCYDDDFE